jgi:hypothetical protein
MPKQPQKSLHETSRKAVTALDNSDFLTDQEFIRLELIYPHRKNVDIFTKIV